MGGKLAQRRPVPMHMWSNQGMTMGKPAVFLLSRLHLTRMGANPARAMTSKE
jgi:hypothetical protein